VGEGAEVVGDGARWSEIGRGNVVVVVGEGSGMGWLLEVREVGQWEVMVVGGEEWGAGSWSLGVQEWGVVSWSLWGRVVVVVGYEGVGGGRCRVVVVGRSSLLLWVRERRW
jgi:hypothetical protein